MAAREELENTMRDSTQTRQGLDEHLVMALPALQAAPHLAAPQAVRAQRPPIADGYAYGLANDGAGGPGVIATPNSADTDSHFVHLHNNLREAASLPPAVHISTAEETSRAPAAAAAAFLAPSSAEQAHPTSPAAGSPLTPRSSQDIQDGYPSARGAISNGSGGGGANGMSPFIPFGPMLLEFTNLPEGALFEQPPPPPDQTDTSTARQLQNRQKQQPADGPLALTPDHSILPPPGNVRQPPPPSNSGLQPHPPSNGLQLSSPPGSVIQPLPPINSGIQPPPPPDIGLHMPRPANGLQTIPPRNCLQLPPPGSGLQPAWALSQPPLQPPPPPRPPPPTISGTFREETTAEAGAIAMQIAPYTATDATGGPGPSDPGFSGLSYPSQHMMPPPQPPPHQQQWLGRPHWQDGARVPEHCRPHLTANPLLPPSLQCSIPYQHPTQLGHHQPPQHLGLVQHGGGAPWASMLYDASYGSGVGSGGGSGGYNNGVPWMQPPAGLCGALGCHSNAPGHQAQGGYGAPGRDAPAAALAGDVGGGRGPHPTIQEMNGAYGSLGPSMLMDMDATPRFDGGNGASNGDTLANMFAIFEQMGGEEGQAGVANNEPQQGSALAWMQSTGSGSAAGAVGGGGDGGDVGGGAHYNGATGGGDDMSPGGGVYGAPAERPEEQGGYGDGRPLQYLSGSKRARVCWEVDTPAASYPQGPAIRMPTPGPGYDAYRPSVDALNRAHGSQMLFMTPNGTAITRSPSGNLGFEGPPGAHTHGGASGASPYGSAVQTNDAPRTGSGGLHLSPSMYVVHPARGGAVASEIHGSGSDINVCGHVGGLRLPLQVQSMGGSGGGCGEALDADGCGSSPQANCNQSNVIKGNLRRASSRMATAAARGPIEPDIPNRNNAGKSTRQRSAGGPRVVRTKKAGSSMFHGVTRHRWTHRWEAHLWDPTVPRMKTGSGGRTRGRQVYLGGFSSEMEAARAYDVASIVFWGEEAYTNVQASYDSPFLQTELPQFPPDEYKSEMTALRRLDKDSVVAMLRRRSKGFSRGASRYRGVTRHHQPGKWEARVGKVMSGRYMYLGCFDTEEAAAMAFDYAILSRRGARAVTNFDPATYHDPRNGTLFPFTCLPLEVRSGITPSSLAELQGPPDSATDAGAGSSDDDDANLRRALGIAAVRVSDAGAASGQQAASPPLPTTPSPTPPQQQQYEDHGFALTVPDPQSVSGADASGVGAGVRRRRSGFPRAVGGMLRVVGEVPVTGLGRSDGGGSFAGRVDADALHEVMGTGEDQGKGMEELGHDVLVEMAGASELNRHGSLIPGAGAPTAIQLTLATAADGRPNAPSNAAPPPLPPANLQTHMPHLPCTAAPIHGEQTCPHDNTIRMYDNQGPCPLFHMPQSYSVSSGPVPPVASNIQGMVAPNNVGTGGMRREGSDAGSNSGFESGASRYNKNMERDANGAGGTKSAGIQRTGTETSYTMATAECGGSGGGMPCSILVQTWYGNEGGGSTAVPGSMCTPDAWPRPPNRGMVIPGGEPAGPAGSPWSLEMHPTWGSGTHSRPAAQAAISPYILYGMESPGGPVDRYHAEGGSQAPRRDTTAAAAAVADGSAGQHGVQEWGNVGPQSMGGADDTVCGRCGALGYGCGPGCGGGNWLVDPFLDMAN